MQYVQGIFKKHPEKKVAFEKAGNAFNEKYLDKLNKANLEAQSKKQDMSFANKWKELKPAFRMLKRNKDTHWRCNICEKPIYDIYADDIEHFRPKGKKETTNLSELSYWWLAYDYRNYYHCCAECNRSYKKEHFPIEKNATRITYEDGRSFEEEKALLINPMYENHTYYFKLLFVLHPQNIRDKVAILRPKDGLRGFQLAKAEKTIEVFNLDLRHKNFVLDKSNASHMSFLPSDTDESRVRLFDSFHHELQELAIKRFEYLSIQEFAEHWKTLSENKNSVTSLGLAQLIALGQFEDLTIQLNR